MKGGFATKQRAERFDALVSGERTPAAAADADLLVLVAAMRDVPPVEARPEFVASLRERLVTEAASMPSTAVDRATVEHLTLHQPSVRRERRVATILGGLAVASATTSMAVASQGALPGEVLYPVKRAIENAQTSFQGDGAQKAGTLLGHAEQRLDEVRRLTEDGSDGTEVSEALDGLAQQSNEAAALAIDGYKESGDPEGVTDVRAFAETALTTLTELSGAVPDDARAALIGAVNTLRNIDAAAAQACAECGGPATLPDPLLVANLEKLLSGEPTDLQSLAQAAEEIAGGTPQEPATDASARPSNPATNGPTNGGGPTAPDGGPLDDPTEVLPEITDPVKDVTGPVVTLLDEVQKGLDELQQDDWTLINNDLLTSLGLSSTDND